MQSLRDLLTRVRRSRLWRVLSRAPSAPASDRPVYLTVTRPILREVSTLGVRVYSLCGCCGTRLSASATLCDACARSRSLPNA